MSDFSDLPDGASIIGESQYSDLPDGAVLNQDTTKTQPKPNVIPSKGNPGNVYNYSQDPVGQVLHQVSKGVPIVGNQLPDKPEDTQFKQEHPVLSALARGTGAVGGSLPLSLAAGPTMAAQGTLFGGLGVGDLASKKYSEGGIDAVTNTPISEYGKTFATDAILTALLGKAADTIISPNAVPKPSEYKIPRSADDGLQDFMSNIDMAERKDYVRQVLRQSTEASKRAIEQGVNNARNAQYSSAVSGVKEAAKETADTSPLYGAATGYLMGGVDGGILGAILAPHAMPIVRSVTQKPLEKYLGNQVLSDPRSKAILQSLIGQGVDTANGSINQ